MPGERERKALQAQSPLACPNRVEPHTIGSNMHAERTTAYRLGLRQPAAGLTWGENGRIPLRAAPFGRLEQMRTLQPNRLGVARQHDRAFHSHA
eukprot:356520-Chlamydomonas_euryale.AAC.1